MIPTCTVTATVADPSGGSLAGVKVTARLSSPVVYQGVIVPNAPSKTTNQQGQAVLQLWPNVLGPTSTTYTFELLLPGSTVPLYFYDVTVPNVSAVTLEELLGGSVPVTNLGYWSGGASWSGSLHWS